MNYTQWIKAELPHLASESSARTFKYIQQAKESTAKSRMIISLVCLAFYVVVGYSIGILFGKYTAINSDLALAISIGVVIWILSGLENQFKNNIVKKELIIIAGKNT